MSKLWEAELSRRAFIGQMGAAAAVVGLAACGVGTSTGSSVLTPKRGGILKVSTADGSTADSLSLYAQSNTFMESMIGSMYETLVFKDNNFKLIPGLATAWSSPDATTWTFKIRQGVKFHDGSPLTSKDVVYSIQQELGAASGTDINALLGNILPPEQVTAPDDSTVVMKLSSPFGFLPNAMANRYGKIFKAGTSVDQFSTKPNGTGPFMFKDFTPGSSFNAVRNPNYWQPNRPYLDGISYTNVPEPASRLQTVLTGEAHWMDAVPAASASQFNGSTTAELEVLKDAIWFGMACNLSVRPFNDFRVIKAMKMAIDRKQVIKVAFAGFASEGFDGPVPSSDPFFPSDLKNTFDPQGAKALLSAAGYPNGLTLPDLVVLPTHGQVAQSTVVQQQLAQVGLKFNIVQAGPNFWSNVYQAVPMFVPEFQRKEAWEIFQLFNTSDEDTNYSPDANDALITQAAQSQDLAQQKQLYAQIIKGYQQNEGWIVPAYAYNVYGRSKKLGGMDPNYVDLFDFTNAFLA
ncbi:MAG TPA: ABC transporter substrate-binding protein [Candidatus Dormibacteraeota bacterium]|jgi:peptide/nickel transport system substrate-binding protein